MDVDNFADIGAQFFKSASLGRDSKTESGGRVVPVQFVMSDLEDEI